MADSEFGPEYVTGSQISSRSKRLRSLVAESSIGTCFFLEKDGNGSELGAGDTAKPDPAYMSHFPVIGDLRSTIRICLGTISGSGPSRSVPATTIPSFLRNGAVSVVLILESSDSPRRKIVTFSITRPLLLP
ncbi:conserved hypothetical protein [Ricinus communis]|uniref:Uncharacterized protein n=1 Tax=Ricinus communis TaxID=3988 RepID=B9RSW2_RICCO|nr:conserved hypothetical protein [Ricinus communis]